MRRALLATMPLLAMLAACGPTKDSTPVAVAPPPPVARTAWEALQASPQHKTLAAAIQTSGLGQTLAGDITLLAPTDAAFAALPQGTMSALTDPRSQQELQKLLRQHIIPGTRTYAQIQAQLGAYGGQTAMPRAGNLLAIRQEAGAMVVVDANGRPARTNPPVPGMEGAPFISIDRVLIPDI